MLNTDLGRRGEALAAAHLAQLGYAILARNWRCSAGEADIVATHAGDLVIIEVKTRRGVGAEGRALASLTPTKQARLLTLAEGYVAEYALDDLGLRVDVVTVAVMPEGDFIEVYENALGW
ncbi:MAG: YraN family protein [Anaerolineales bacterium]